METTSAQARILAGGLVGAGIGLALMALAVFFVVQHDTEEEILGVFIPLTVGLIALGIGTMALVPLWYGDSADRSPAIIAWAFRIIAALGLVITALGVVDASVPWIAFALLPLLACAALIKDSSRLARRARRAR